jgi:predicted TIM-barrel fold metal-dependent hydrolase
VIIDAHAYVFPAVETLGGYDSMTEKWKAVQIELGGHHQPVWRVRDRAPADNSTLINPDTGELQDVRWHTVNGQLVWDYEGEVYTKQYFPPMLNDQAGTPEVQVREMDYIGVDMAVLHNAPHLIRGNAYNREATQKFPDRLKRLIWLRDADTPGDVDRAIAEVLSEVQAGGACGYQFFSKYYYDGKPTESWDGETMHPFWDAVVSTGLPVFFTLHAPKGARYSSEERESYLEQQATLLRWMERYPDTTTVITHGLQWRSFMNSAGRVEFPPKIWDVFKSPRCHLQLLLPIQVGGIWEYPWIEGDAAVQECIEHVGADHLMWGTDMPMVARFCTYRQTLDHYRVHVPSLTDAERADIIGGTIARVIGVV